MATRWWICSTGLIANDFCSALKSLPSSEHEVVAVAGRHKDSADQFAQKFAIPAAYGSYLDLAKDPTVGSQQPALGLVSSQHPDITVTYAPLVEVFLNRVLPAGLGVDTSGTIVLKYKGGAMAVLFYSIVNAFGNNSLTLYGSKGNLQLEAPFHCPTQMTVAGNKVLEFPLPPPYTYNFVSSQGFVYEARCVRQCLLDGLLECPRMPHKDSINIMTILKEGQRQLGVTF